MVKKLLTILNKESSNVNEAALLLGVLTLLSQLLGLFRDKALAHFIGPSTTLDVYYAAFRIPDFLYISIGSLVSITVLIPFLLERMKGEDVARARKFLSDIFTSFLLVMITVAGLAYVYMPRLSAFVAPGFSPVDQIELITISRIMLLSPILLGLSNLLGTVTQLFKKFFIFSLSPVFYNIGIITGVVFFYPLWGIQGLAFGVILGSLLHLVLQMPTVFSHQFIPRFALPVDLATVRQTIFVSLPRTLALSLNNLALLAIIAIASTLGAGAISVFTLSYNLQSVPLAIIGISYSVAAFPTLARFFSDGEHDKFSGSIVSATRQIIFWSLPVVVLFIVLRAQIVRVIFGSGFFSWSDTKLVAASLALFSLSVVAQSLNVLFVRGYYAAGKTRKPLGINFIFSIATVALSVIFVRLFTTSEPLQLFFESVLRVSGIPGTVMLMLPLALSIGTIANCVALWLAFKRDFVEECAPLARTFLESLCAVCVMALVSYGALVLFGNYFDINTFWGILWQGLLAGMLGLAAWGVILILFRNKECMSIIATLKKKFWKAPLVAPEQQDL
jgi:putative peptidoglycan lipid II flippase